MGSKLKKLLDDPKVKNFLRSPELAMLLLVFVSITIIMVCTKRDPNAQNHKIVPSAAEITSTETSSATTISTTSEAAETTTVSEETTTETSAETTTDTETTTAETTETVTTTETASEHHKIDSAKVQVPADPDISKYITAGISPNANFYQQRLAIAGDSIAYGFNAFGYIPDEHNLAQESVSMWNLEGFTFYGGYGLVDATSYVDPEILYISMGMNDVNMNDTASFTSKYKSVIHDILSDCTDITIIVAGITPIGYETSFTTNERIREYNSALKDTIVGMNDKRVCYFDAYSVVCDDYGMLRDDCSGGDGIHLQNHCYGDILNTLYNFLDDTNVKAHIEKIEH